MPLKIVFDVTKIRQGVCFSHALKYCFSFETPREKDVEVKKHCVTLCT